MKTIYENKIIQSATNFTKESDYNYIPKSLALSEKLVGMKIFEDPIFAFGDAHDDYFVKLQKDDVIGNHFMVPNQWLESANTVISYFLPYTDVIKKGNKINMSWPSDEWLHGRIEGQEFLKKLTLLLQNEIIDLGYDCVAPSLDNRIFSVQKKEKYFYGRSLTFTSNWSERHVAFVCGLGTFGLSKGIITKKGMAGRFGSVITNLKITPTKREYEDIYEFCTMCGKCALNCPAKAISKENGKDHVGCSQFLDKVKEKHETRFGCGKCQVGVPCESKTPVKNN